MSHAPTRNEGVTTFSWVTGIAKSDGAGLELKFGAQTAFVSKAVLMSPTEFVRMAIIDKYGDSGSQNALKAFHCLSEDQCRALVKDQDKLNAWLASKFLLYKEEGETKSNNMFLATQQVPGERNLYGVLIHLSCRSENQCYSTR